MSDTPARLKQPAEHFSIDAFPDDMSGWRCHRCIRYAGPYGSRDTAEREAHLHQQRDHTGDG